MNDDIMKALNIIVLAIGMATTALIVMARMDVFAKQTKAQVTLYAYDVEWQSFQYQQSLRGSSNKVPSQK